VIHGETANLQNGLFLTTPVSIFHQNPGFLEIQGLASSSIASCSTRELPFNVITPKIKLKRFMLMLKLTIFHWDHLS
jgi:hypothetical protein